MVTVLEEKGPAHKPCMDYTPASETTAQTDTEDEAEGNVTKTEWTTS